MSELRDEQLEVVLSEHLHGRLDARLGGASRRFAQHLSQHRSSIETRLTTPALRPPRRWVLPTGLLGAALAAAVTMVVLNRDSVDLLNSSSISEISDSKPSVVPFSQPEFMPMVREAAWKTTSEGVIDMTDGSQAQLLKRERTDRLKWIDPRDNSVIEYCVPRTETMLIGLERH